MAVYMISFSPTGGTKKVADCLTKSFGPKIQEIDLTEATADYGRFSFSCDDICNVAVPSFLGGGCLPRRYPVCPA